MKYIPPLKNSRLLTRFKIIFLYSNYYQFRHRASRCSKFTESISRDIAGTRQDYWKIATYTQKDKFH